MFSAETAAGAASGKQKKTPLFPALAAAFATGLGAGWAEFSFGLFPAAGIVFAAALAAAAATGRKKTALAAFAFLAGAMVLKIDFLKFSAQNRIFYPPATCITEGSVVSRPRTGTGIWPNGKKATAETHFDFYVTRCPARPQAQGSTARVRLRGGTQASLRPGDALSLRGLILSPAAGTQRYSGNTRRWEILALGQNAVSLVPPRSARQKLWAWRQRTLELISRAVSSPRPELAAPGAVVAAALTGDRVDIDPELLDALKNTNTLHLLAISGFNFGLLYLSLLLLLRLAGLPRRGQLALCLALGTAYAWLVGFPPSVQRAWLMISLVLTARLCGRETRALDAIGISALAFLAIRPQNLFDIGFQLTYLITFFLLTLDPAKYAARRLDGWRRWGLEALSLSAVAWVGSELVLIPAFGQLSFSGLALNPPATLVFTLIMAQAGLSFAAYFLLPHALWEWLPALNARITQGLLDAVGWFSDIGWLSFRLESREAKIWGTALFALAALALYAAARRAEKNAVSEES